MNYITLIGFFAAIFTTSAYLPQAIKIMKTKKTSDISLIMYIVMETGTLLWLLYGILLKSSPLIVANSIGLTIISTILILKLIYR